MDDRIFPEQAIIKTSKGTFHLKLSKHINRDTNQVEHYTINLGSYNKKCVQIDVPLRDPTGTLIWVEGKGVKECSLEAFIEKGLAKHMVLLGCTIARDINPHLRRLNLDDCSKFDCRVQALKTIPVSMKAFHIAFHGTTWYEYNFNAKLQFDHEVYLELKKHLYSPEHKPLRFDFMNEELSTILKPLYNQTTTWHNFFQLIQQTYKDTKCAKVYPWIHKALGHIFEYREMFENRYWCIDFKDNEKIPLIPFRAYRTKQAGGVRCTRKRRAVDHLVPEERPLPFMNIPEIQSWTYRK
jgi:hypothetical protein